MYGQLEDACGSWKKIKCIGCLIKLNIFKEYYNSDAVFEGETVRDTLKTVKIK